MSRVSRRPLGLPASRRSVWAAIAIIACPAAVAAQETPLRPRFDDARLWSLPSGPPYRSATQIPMSPAPARAESRAGLAGGYVMGTLIGLRVGGTTSPPPELGLWLRGWYDGALVPGPDGHFGRRPSSGIPGAGGTGRASDSQLVDGIVRGFLNGLALASSR